MNKNKEISSFIRSTACGIWSKFKLANVRFRNHIVPQKQAYEMGS